jgi:hypothetical protein
MKAGDNMCSRTQTTIGDLVVLFYDEFLELYGDPVLASVAAAAVINDHLAKEDEEDQDDDDDNDDDETIASGDEVEQASA